MSCILPKRIIVVVLVFAITAANAQTARIEILKSALGQSDDKIQRLGLILNICEQHYSLSSDTLLSYINMGRQYCRPGSDEWLMLENYRCIYFYKQGRFHDG